VDGAEDGTDDIVGINEIEGLADGVADHREINGLQMGLPSSLRDPNLCVLKETLSDKSRKHPFGELA